MRVLDLFGRVGAAAKGYADAGFEVVSVDPDVQPDNPFPFFQDDPLNLTSASGQFKAYDLVHASPPRKHPDLYGPVRKMLQDSGVPYVIENPAARPDVTLCGRMFGLWVIRHRFFELGGWSTGRPAHRPHHAPYFAVYDGGKGSVPQWQYAMGIDWTDNRKSIAEAIPPAYTEWVGHKFIEWKKENSHG